MKVLIADDDQLSRLVVERTLLRAGYEVIAVENGQLAAQQLLMPDGPRLALLDWEMPEINGPGVCKKVRNNKDQNYVYMILLTSKESKLDMVAGLESGADDYLTKPFDAQELKARLRTGERILRLEDNLVEAREQMRFKATHDTLTTLLNRGVVMDLLGRELSRSAREHTTTAVLLADLDHFKSINDTYGHAAGDEVLKETAKRMLDSVRPYDFVGRYGGEEFLIVLNNCDPLRAIDRAEQIRKTIANTAMPIASGQLPVTMSAGLILSSEWRAASATQLLVEVDAALYQAKAAGRNCIRIADPTSKASVAEIPAPQTVRQIR